MVSPYTRTFPTNHNTNYRDKAVARKGGGLVVSPEVNEQYLFWDFVAATVLDQLVDWFYGQIVGFLGNFFALMGNMGVELSLIHI